MKSKKSNDIVLIPQEVIEGKILLIRGKKIILDSELAVLYDVETKQLTRQVRRNIDRFPDDFMFQLTREELENYEDLKDLREAKESSKCEESIPLSKVINDLDLK